MNFTPWNEQIVHALASVPTWATVILAITIGGLLGWGLAT